MGAWMDRRELADLNRVEDAEDVELALLGEVGGVGKESESNAHDSNIERQPTRDEGGTRDLGWAQSPKATGAMRDGGTWATNGRGTREWRR
jgi:hypothetical protein